MIQRWAAGVIATVIAASSLLLLLPATHAATGIVAYVPIMLTNNQGSATPTTFQQKITWNPSTYSSYEASDLGNVRFCADIACATTLSAWLESCTPSCSTSATSASAWVKLTSAILGSGGTQTVYMTFLLTSTHFDGVYWGEAPNIPGTYGANDNGANVFTFYDNFAGTSLSSKWTTVSSSGGGGATIALDATSNSVSGLGAVSSYSWAHTVGTGLSNSILIVGATVEKSSGFEASTVTYNGVSLTKKVGVGTGTAQLKASLWYLLNPPSGAHTVQVTLSGTVGTDGAAGGAVSLSGVDQTTPMPTTNSKAGTGTPSQSITTVNANSWTVHAMSFDSSSTKTTTGTGQTRRWALAAGGMSGQGSTLATTTAGSYTMSWSGSDNYAVAIAEVNPASSTPSCTVSVNNGATFTTSTSSAWCFVAAAPIAYPSVSEAYMVSSGSVNPMMGVSTSYSSNAPGVFSGLYNGYAAFWNSGANTRFASEKSTGYGLLQSTTQTTFPAGIWQVIWSATGSERFADGAGNSYIGTDSGVTIANYGIYAGQTANAAGSNVVDWGRMRAYPPGGVTPIAVFGSLVNVSTTTTTTSSTLTSSTTTSTTSTTTTSSTSSTATTTSSASTSSTTSKITSTTTSSSTTTTTGKSTTSALTSTSSQTSATSTTTSIATTSTASTTRTSIASTSTASRTTTGGSFSPVLGLNPLLLGGVALVGGAVAVAVVVIRRRPHTLIP